MVPISFIIWIGIVEAMIFALIIDAQRPDKKTRDKIKEFAVEYDMPVYAARNRILSIFFKAYETGLKEKMKEAHKKDTQSFEEWKTEQEAKFQKDLETLERENEGCNT